MHLQRARGHNPPQTVYVTAVLTVGFGLLLAAWAGRRLFEGAVPPSEALAFWLLFSLAAEGFWLPSPGRRSMVSMSLCANIAVLFVLPVPHALTVAAASVGLSDLLLHRRGIVRAAFNSAQTTIALGAAVAAMNYLRGATAPTGSQILLLYPLATLVPLIVFPALNVLLVSGVLAIEKGQRFWTAWRESYGFWYHYLSCAMLFFVGLGLVIAIESVGYICGLVSLLILLCFRETYRYYTRTHSVQHQ
jgi:hypothetical protein